jgi:hypothetical protein
MASLPESSVSMATTSLVSKIDSICLGWSRRRIATMESMVAASLGERDAMCSESVLRSACGAAADAESAAMAAI